MRRQRYARTVRMVFVVLIALLCPEGEAGAQSLSLVNTVSVGDSYAAGVQNGVLKSDGQVHSYVTLLSRQMVTFLFQPLIPEPGFGNEISLVDGELVVGPPTSSERTFPLVIPQNLAVPSQGIVEALQVRPSLPLDSLEDIILGLPILVVPLGIPPASQIELAVGLQPTLTIFWLGFDDVLRTAVFGVEPLPLEVFQQAYGNAVGALLTLTTTRMIVANIPDVTVLPYLTSSEEIAASVGAPLPAIGPLLGIQPGDFVRLPGLPMVEAILSGQIPGPLPEQAVFRADRVASLRLLTAQMNGFISALAQRFGVPLVDLHTAFQELDFGGIEVLGQMLTTDFFGGIFSLDGIHPTNTGHGFIANRFIDGLNSSFGAGIAPIDLDEVAASDPLFPDSSFENSSTWRILSRSSTAGVEDILSSASRRLRPADDLDPGQDPLPGGSRSLQDSFSEGFNRFFVNPGPVWTLSVPREGTESSGWKADRREWPAAESALP